MKQTLFFLTLFFCSCHKGDDAAPQNNGNSGPDSTTHHAEAWRSYKKDTTSLLVVYNGVRLVRHADSAYYDQQPFWTQRGLYAYFSSYSPPDIHSGACLYMGFEHFDQLGERIVADFAPNSFCYSFSHIIKGIGHGVSLTIRKYDTATISGYFEYFLLGDTLCGAFNKLPIRR